MEVAGEGVSCGSVGAGRVAFVLWSGVAGGAESVSIAVAAEMRRSGHDARLIFVGRPDPLSVRLDQLCVPWTSLGIGRSRQAFVRGKEIATVLEEWAPDGVVLPTVDAMAAVLRHARYSGRIIAVDHGSLWNLRAWGLKKLLLKHTSRIIGVRAVDWQIGVSAYMRDQLLRLPHAKNVSVIYNGVDPDSYCPAESPSGVTGGQLRLGAACRLVPGKGLPELIKLVDRLSDVGLDFRLDIAGTGPLEAMLRGQVEARHGRVRLVGHVNDMPAFWQAQDVAMVVPNELTETFGMVAAEAMACGLPVIATRNGGLEEVVEHGVTGILVDRGDVAAAVQAVLWYWRDPGARAAHGAAGRTRVIDMFTVKQCASAYLDLLL